MQVLIIFRAKRHEFWYEELDALLEIFLLEPSTVYERKALDRDDPFLVCSFPSILLATQIISRSVMIKMALELWSQANTIDELIEQVKDKPPSSMRRYIAKPGIDIKKGDPWRFDVWAYGQSYTIEEQKVKREKILEHIEFQGPVRMKAQRLNIFCLVENIAPSEENPERKPKKIFFGKHITDGMIHTVERFSLKSRKFLGPTSMESELAFIMANQAKIQKSSLVLDPFVGTGSILIAAAYYGAYCFGCDIDARILEGKDHDCFSNFKQYNMPLPDLWRMDFSPRGNSCFRIPEGGLFDAIICDPPYGIRAGARKSGSRKSVVKPVLEKYKADHIAATQVYPSHELMPELVDSAARYLCIGGRFVYLLPVFVENYVPSMIPQHPCLKLIANSEDFLTLKTSRRLITMEKIKKYEYAFQVEYFEALWQSSVLLKEENELPGSGKTNTEHEVLDNSSKPVRYHFLSKEERKEVKKKAREEIKHRRQLLDEYNYTQHIS